MALPTTLEMLASLDDELVDLLAERMRLVDALSSARTDAELDEFVVRMRNQAMVYGAPADMVATIARTLAAEERSARSGR